MAFGFDPFQLIPHPPTNLTQWICGICDLRFYEPVLCGGADFYAELSRRFSWYYEENKWEFDIAVSLLNQARRIESVLEIGCGEGHFLQKMANAAQVRGLEFNKDAVRACLGKGLKVTDAPIDSVEEKFDAVLAFEVIEHLAEPAPFLTSMVSRLNPNGLLIIGVPNPHSYLAEADHVLLDMPPHHVTAWSAKTLSYVEQKLGLKLLGIHQEPLRYVHYQAYLRNLMLAHDASRTGRVWPVEWLSRFLDRVSGRLSARVINTIAAATYQANKSFLTGQTHLAVYSNEKY